MQIRLPALQPLHEWLVPKRKGPWEGLRGSKCAMLKTLMRSKPRAVGGRGSYLPCILLNKIQTTFSQLAKRSSRVLLADLCTDHAHYVKNPKINVFEKYKNMAVESGTVSHYYILVIPNFIGFMSLFKHSMWFALSFTQFSFAEF